MQARFTRRMALVLAAAGLWAGPSIVSGQAHAQAQSWPSRPITLIMPFAAGGGTDLLARALAQDLGERLGQQVVVDNRAGAGGNIAAGMVAKAPPDGYTIMFGTPGPLANNKLMYKSLPFDPEQAFAPIVLIAKSPLIVAAKASLPVKTLAELKAYATANPGKLNVGVPGSGTLGHITSVLLQKALGITMTNVPYRGTAPVVNDLLGDQVDLAMDFMPSYVPLVKDGRVRALAVTTTERSRDLPDVPTVQDAGVKGFEATAWYALAAPAGTPAEIIDKLNAATNAFLKSPKGQDALAQLSMQAVGGTPAELKAFISSELEKWGPVVKDAKISM
ncbi:tripartite tricarboxylate transporter substrate binding protein [Rhodoplanes sp. TEM]|uniref:Tripartite tricarboxylate transporter substrate binding protein n=1 Tax=Rhodoplanes tepidamans TaxID=200616 RepID=A0ABT5J9M6_RHOTP|nr:MULTISPECIES: tripartite tricarboxylate transporter substrate binding protein [Rhodoplanes]MDC7786339.1 tripartite tricarboxylate transporter substrate binding protein [Rhodoplanes tepidamans]MDC7984702.1 tripartite tricarboxylate transporter substrate binding protein [Rhodoplanes sp. TEM]MDQ0354082.1 tripartite-type tricarboxylate transporter receptor subunit TctC [Rhodoplanes tepidamans]